MLTDREPNHWITKNPEQIGWIIKKHADVNHFYDTYLPYEFHLRMVVNVFKDFRFIFSHVSPSVLNDIELACWGHDLIEDTRTSYNDVMAVLGGKVADAIYAVTNEKGRTRSERANEKYYSEMRKTDYAVFVKLCDRIANVQYSKLTKSRMFQMYQKEHPSFKLLIGYYEGHPYQSMFTYLDNLFIQDEPSTL